MWAQDPTGSSPPHQPLAGQCLQQVGEVGDQAEVGGPSMSILAQGGAVESPAPVGGQVPGGRPQWTIGQ